MSINTTIRDYHYNKATSKEAFLKKCSISYSHHKMTTYYKLPNTTLTLLHTTVTNKSAARRFNLHPGWEGLKGVGKLIHRTCYIRIVPLEKIYISLSHWVIPSENPFWKLASSCMGGYSCVSEPAPLRWGTYYLLQSHIRWLHNGGIICNGMAWLFERRLTLTQE